jgi:gliding motility-associated transport system ATP-binding protein
MDIVVDNLTKTYGIQKAVDSISFHVKSREILGFLGPNGAGKTTTMKILTCFMAPSGGDVKIGEHSIHDNQEIIKSKIGYLPENNPLYLDMPVLEYLEYVAQLQNVAKEKIKDRIAEMVITCGIDREKHKKIGELSKGYRQRVGLAQAMIHDPEILILDEPTTGLDPNQIIEIRKLIRNLGREKTLILSTHILPEVEATCDRILIINHGKIVADGSPETLRKQAQGQEVLRVRIEEAAAKDIVGNSLRSLGTVGMVDPVQGSENLYVIQSRAGQSSKKEIFKLCVTNNWILTELTPIETKLEDIFRELTTN